MKSRALFFDAPRAVALRDVELPELAADTVRVSALASAVSAGTELLLYKGEAPVPFDVSVGATTYPLRYGYAWVGTRGGDDRVFGLLPHGDAHVVRVAALRDIPAGIPAPRATLAANLETAITCAWDAEANLGDRAVVLGGGTVGVLAAWLLGRAGAAVHLVEPRVGRRRAAQALVREASIPRGAADLVIEATGDPRALDDAIGWAAPGARIVVASFYGTRRAAVDLGDAFHRKRLALVASQVSSIPPRLAPRWSFDRRFDLVRDLLTEPALDALVAPPVPFGRAAELYARLAAGDDDGPPCHVFEYG